MAYITLEELKKILPGILDQWIDKDDESWEWIFQEIEQKCHIGKKKKYKKPKKKDIQNAMEIAIMAHRNDIDKLSKLLDGQINNTKQLALSMKDMGTEIRHIREDVKSAKSMAEIAKNRTDVKYNEIGIEKKPPHISYTLWSSAKHMLSVFEQRGATKEELEQLDFLFSKYILDVDMNCQPSNNFSYADGKTAKEVKEIIDCMRCKHYCGDGVIKEPCIGCTDYDCWEAKDE